jgi:hypothetical protein
VQIDNKQEQMPLTMRKKKQQLAAVDAMVKSTPNTSAPLALFKARPERPKKKVVAAS